MNENKNNTNGHIDRDNQQQADAFVEALETDSRLTGSLTDERAAIAKFGDDIRESADVDLPPANVGLRDLLQQRLGGSADGPVEIKTKQSSTPSTGRMITPARLAMAACVLLAVTLLALSLPMMNESFNMANLGDEVASEQALPVVIIEADRDGETAAETAQKELAGAEQHGQQQDQAGAGFSFRLGVSGGQEVREELFDNTDRTSSSDGAQANASGLSELGAKEKSIIPRFDDSESMALSPAAEKAPSAPTNNAGNGVAVAKPSSNSVSGQVVPGLDRPAGPGRVMSGSTSKETGTIVVEGIVVSRNDGRVGGGGRGEGRGFGGGGGGFGGRGRGFNGRTALEGRSGEQYEPIHENAFIVARGQQALSTFSIDVDTASYSNMRRFLNGHQLPPRNAVRIEELINYFDYDYPQPEDDSPFSVDMEFASCPWNQHHHLLRVGLQGKEIPRSERSPSNLVFLLDVSGSMQNQDKLPLLKQGLSMMVQRLTENDSVSIVTYAGNAGVVLEPTNGANKPEIEAAIQRLNAGGSTNGSAGINLAYELAQKQFIAGGSNRVILATDGDLNVGVTSDSALVDLVKQKASEGVFLTVLGFGTGNLKDSKLEKMADNGNGMYAYIDSFREAHKVLIEQMSGALETIAKDVKIQIEFNPAQVASYRLIGYENRVLAAKDFDDDKKDAGEIGAGHSVTALYEIKLAAGAQAAVAGNQPLRYQDQPQVEKPEPANAKAELNDEVLTVSLRYKQPDKNESQKIQFALKSEPVTFSSASSDFQFAATVAAFGMLLRQSEHRGTASFDWIEATASRCVGDDVAGRRIEFLDLVRKAANRSGARR